MRRLVEVEPVLVADAPALGAFIARELELFGRIELSLGTMRPGMVGGVTKTIDDATGGRFARAREYVAIGECELDQNKAVGVAEHEEIGREAGEAYAELDAAERLLEQLRDGLEHLADANMVPHGPEEADVRDVVSRRAGAMLELLGPRPRS